jgi:hypothetical protein
MTALLPIFLFVTTDIYEKVKTKRICHLCQHLRNGTVNYVSRFLYQKTKSTLALQMYCGLHFQFRRAHYLS